MTIVAAPNRTRIEQLAREGMSRQGGQTFPNARAVGEKYLGTISREAPGTLDGVLAASAMAASGKRVYDESAYNCQNLALQALAAGVGGPIGPALASLGHQAIYKTVWHDASYAYSDGRLIGSAMLDAIVDHGQAGAEKSLAAAARASVSGWLYHESAFKVEAEALQRLKANVQGDDVVRTLADFGSAARMKCLDNDNAIKVAGPILEAIEQAGDPRAAAIARVAHKAGEAGARDEARSLAQAAGFSAILATPKGTVTEDLAAYGTRALNHCSYADDQRTLGHAILRGIRDQATTDAARLVAKTADEATCPRLYHSSAAGVHYEAFHVLSDATITDAGKALATLGQRVLGRGETVEDTRTMAQVVLASLASHETDAVRKGVLDSAVGLAKNAASDQVAVGIQKFAFNWLIKAPALPPVAVSDGASSTDPTVLQQRLGLNETVQKMLSDEITRASAELSGKQSDMTALANRFNPMVATDGKLLKQARMARFAFFAGAAAGVGGLLTTALLPAGVGHAVALGGGLLAIGASFASSAIDGSRKRLLDKFWPLRNEYDRLDGEAQGLKASAAASRAMLGGIEEAIRKDKGALEVLQMSQSLNGTPPKDAGTITMTQDEVTIGGIRISRAKPKQAMGDDGDAPAVKE